VVTNWKVIPPFFSSTFHEIAVSKFDNPSRRYNQDENLRKVKHQHAALPTITGKRGGMAERMSSSLSQKSCKFAVAPMMRLKQQSPWTALPFSSQHKSTVRFTLRLQSTHDTGFIEISLEEPE
jgi:hypothetical protein